MTGQAGKSQAGKSRPRPDQAQPSQAAPTRPRPRDADGNELDAWGLPIAGPLRARRLTALGMPDPNTAPEAWSSAGAGEATSSPVAPDVMEDGNG